MHQPVIQDLWPDMAGAAATVGNIIAGASLAGTSASALANSLSSEGYIVATVIEIENHTKWGLYDAKSWAKWGQIRTAPSIVKPGEKEAWTTHKTNLSVVGSAGVIYYSLEGLDEVLAIAWDVPVNQIDYSNYLAIGLYSGDDFEGIKTFDEGYDILRNGKPSTQPSTTSPTWPWSGRDYYSTIEVCQTCSPNILVHCSMGTSRHPTIEIKVYARNSSNKAPKRN